MSQITVFLADNQYLTLEGLRSLVSSNSDFSVVGEAHNSRQLIEKAPALQPDVIIMDYTGEDFSLNEVGHALTLMPLTKILALTGAQKKSTMLSALSAGIKSYVLKDCSREEIINAIYATAKGEKFFCGKVLDVLANENLSVTKESSASCQALNISDRELEIIRLIAEGYSNKEIADKLFLSLHTVNTHRKNIMNKLGVNNTAGIVIFAVKEHIISPNKYLFSNS